MTSTDKEDAAAGALAADTSRSNPQSLPSIHIRATITWLAIFPLVTIAMLVSEPFIAGWHPVGRSFVLTLIVVPIAVYIVVPQLLRAYGAALRR